MKILKAYRHLAQVILMSFLLLTGVWFIHAAPVKKAKSEPVCFECEDSSTPDCNVGQTCVKDGPAMHIGLCSGGGPEGEPDCCRYAGSCSGECNYCEYDICDYCFFIE